MYLGWAVISIPWAPGDIPVMQLPLARENTNNTNTNEPKGYETVTEILRKVLLKTGIFLSQPDLQILNT